MKIKKKKNLQLSNKIFASLTKGLLDQIPMSEGRGNWHSYTWSQPKGREVMEIGIPDFTPWKAEHIKNQ